MSIERDRSFNNAAFYAALDAARRARDLTWKELAQDSGVSASTLTRIGQGRRPDVDSFAALVKWAGLDSDDFMGRHREGEAAPLAQISVLLRHDPRLSEEAASAIDELIRVTYERLAKES
jgi:transcriptional regulator with XRE-family HTH domain